MKTALKIDDILKYFELHLIIKKDDNTTRRQSFKFLSGKRRVYEFSEKILQKNH